MSELTIKILNLIKENKTVNEISEETGLSNKQIYNIIAIIKNKGFNFERKYYSNGELLYLPQNKLADVNDDSVGIITSDYEKSVDVIVISDLHFGNENERLDLLYKVYNYCAENNYHIIIIGGDLIDGSFGKSGKYIDPFNQIDYFLKEYPFDKNILNFAVLGDHDYSVLNTNYQNIIDAINSYRHDIIPLGYQFGKIRIKKDEIYVKHRFNFKYDDDNVSKCIDLKKGLLLAGHTHNVLNISKKGNLCRVNIPSLSDINPYTNEFLPSITHINLSFYNDIIDYANFEQLLIIYDTIYKVNEMSCNISSEIKYKDDKYIENIKVKTNKRMKTVTNDLSDLGNYFNK